MGGRKKWFNKEFSVGIIVTIIICVVPMTWYWMAFLWAILTILSTHLIFSLPINRKSYRMACTLVFCIILIILGSYLIHDKYINDNNKVMVSPSELTITSPMDDHFVLSVINKQDFNIYNVNMSICLNYRTSDFSWIEILPAKDEKESIKDFPIPMVAVISNYGCEGIVFGNISPHQTKEFNVTIKGKSLPAGSKIAFRVYNWYLEPNFKSIPVDKAYALHKEPPQNFQDLFDEKSDKTGHAYAIKMKMPTNPFLNDKADPKDYGVIVIMDR